MTSNDERRLFLSRIAVRKNRWLKGVYILTEEDAAKGNAFEDTIGWRSGYLDLMGFKFTDMRNAAN